MSSLAHIGLGSNLGDRKATLDGAIAAMREMRDVVVHAVSGCHETPAVGGPAGQQPFLNAAASIETSLAPHALLARLWEIEARFGRVRRAHWGERTLDLDLLLFDQEVIDSPELIVPHLHFALRRFVLAPLAEIAADQVDPLTRRTVEDLLANLDRRPSIVALARSISSHPLADRLCKSLEAMCFHPSTVGDILHALAGGELPSRRAAASYDITELSLRGMYLHFSRLLSENQGWLSWDGPRWIVLPFWVDELLGRAGPDIGDLRGRTFFELRRLLQPTFVVMAGEEARLSIAEWTRAHHVKYPVGCDAPVLRLRPITGEQDDEMAPESVTQSILAACQATRA